MNGSSVGVTTSATSTQWGGVSDADLARMLLIRHFELNLLALFTRGEISGTTHTCLGQEYIPVALMSLIAPAFVFSNHRGHGHYLAQFDDAAGLLAEITGREGAVCAGRGGSQHIFRPGFCSTGVQGESVPAALGVALHMKSTGRPVLAVAYIGDGTWGQGVVYEALNMAQLWQAPLVVVVENNHIAQTTPTRSAMAGSIRGRAAAFGVRYEYVEGCDVQAIRAQLEAPIRRTRDGGGPVVVEFDTIRLGPHSKGDDARDPAAVALLRERDWYEQHARRDPERFQRLDASARRIVADVTRDVLSRPLVGARAAR
ncbi:thiamine pyrophosphate-dependent dehydrogenase E1 component subunit alpha [Dactylosporangium sp. NPDC051485]|uniref:thiamine pyrophosphate-dependent dehydrogenase E1 component subunit alpha n=1 Tax=Dactylosporangium sp. NPDC051485 TaxID=3154846 RepID=UPI0034186D26